MPVVVGVIDGLCAVSVFACCTLQLLACGLFSVYPLTLSSLPYPSPPGPESQCIGVDGGWIVTAADRHYLDRWAPRVERSGL